MIYIWLGIFIVTLLVEIAVPSLVSIWFSAGSLVSLLLAVFLGDSLIWLQILAFVITSIGTILLLRPSIKKRQNLSSLKTNIDSIVGSKGICVDTINALNHGSVKINTTIWNASLSNEDDKEIEKGAIITVLDIKGNTLIVKKENNNE